MYRKARVFQDYAVADDIMATQLPEAVIEVLFGESLEPSMAQRTGSSGTMAQRAGFSREHVEKIYKDVVGTIKALGRQVGSSPNTTKFDDSLWDPRKYAFVLDAVRSKFKNGLCEARTRAIADFLKSTGELTIVEAAHYDKVWGVGFGVDEFEKRVCIRGEDGEWEDVLSRKLGIIVGGMKAVATARSSLPSAVEQGFAFGRTSGPDNWPDDSNLLGHILMQVRNELAAIDFMSA